MRCRTKTLGASCRRSRYRATVVIIWRCANQGVDVPSAHDRGGLPSREPIDQTSHEWADWEHLVNAMMGVLRRHGLINVDELRRGIEAMTPAEYESSSYYERWSASIEHILVEKGVLSTEEITAATREIDAEWG
ncbi:MAG: nitrile hydratase subunit beta [Gammaproteobacteria bacterium]|nr:nitrile hydratase subunit beta [Gammaproteobacteria bacterium]MYF28890.1 nitrile hydratase subunit beta [Gammaproteobacteria bacterium]MYK48080.1 nitrile hydratase subunit beta [Gammaproteobacteria bacterium]